MKERQKHIDAFDTYYGLGTKRSLAKLHQHLTKTVPSGTKVTSLSTLKIWSHKFSWQERILLRDTEISKKVEKKILKAEEDTRINSYTRILKIRDRMLAAVDTAFYKDKKDGIIKIRPDISVNSARELRDVALGALKCETEALHILAPEPPQEPSTVTITIKSVRDLPDKN
jgi:hypothetical protein